VKKTNTPNVLNELHEAAAQAQKNAYAPYSKFYVGAALKTSDGNIYSGCNVENASYGGTICAERTAITSAITAEGKIKITDICVVTSGKKPWPPCGLCRQVIMEFATKETKVHVANEKGIQKTYAFKDLLPEAFGPENLEDN
jgi:cytidine deaminase